MATSLIIIPTDLSHGSSSVFITFKAFAQPDSGALSGVAEVAWNALAAEVNAAIKDAAVQAAANAGYTVGALDKKTLIGGAVGL